MNVKVLLAVLKRNFVSYFANPTGYVFICVFVLLSTISAFWPNEFFNTNLANLDQLNKLFPFIMLVFVPAITMAVWADERRQGTDELLLTIPAGDFEIVLGKYLAALAIYTVSLAFSLVCNYWVLQTLGDPDVGLFLGTYVGYWLIGVAMLAIGMVASFLTPNLTVAYILGAALCAPLVFAVASDSIMPREPALAVKQWSIGEQFGDFGRGILSLSGLAYFGMIMAVMLYLCMVLIGRRHWPVPGKYSFRVVLISRAVLFVVLLSFIGIMLWPILNSFINRLPHDPDAVLGIGYTSITGLIVSASLTRLLLPVYAGGGARDTRSYFMSFLWVHHLVRFVALVLIAGSLTVLFHARDIRLDVTSERLSSLSADTVKLLKNLEIQRPVQIEAFVSPQVPELYVQTRLDVLSMLRELEARGAGKVHVRVNPTDRFSEEAARAEQRYDISPRRVVTMSRGTTVEDHIFMGVAFTCGLEKVILPFIDRGIPAEYELVRSIATVTQQARKHIGVLRTDAQLYGQFDMATMSPGSRWPIIEELEKQYEVEEVDPTSDMTGTYDALLAVQPSSLGPDEMDRFIEAVRSGRPTAIFEDPLPLFAGRVPGTSAPRRPPGGMNPWMGGQPPEKGQIRPLWTMLGIDFSDDQVIWQDHNPIPKLSHLPREFVFVDAGVGVDEPFNPSASISSKLQHLLFPFPGSIRKLHASDLEFTPLVRTGDRTGTVRYWEVMQFSPFGMGGGLNPNRRQIPTNESYVLAAQIRGKLPPGLADSDDEESSPEQEPEQDQRRGLNVVLVSDIDMLHEEFFRLREMGNVPEAGIQFDFDNVTFVLNALDALAGDQRFLELRKRRPKHRTLTRIEEQTEKARKDTVSTVEKLRADFETAKDEEDQRLKDRIAKLEERMKKERLDLQEIATRVALAQQDGDRRMQAKLDRLEQERDQQINRIETELALRIRQVQDWYKFWAVVLPPIPPLAVAVVVFFTRRRQERIGVARSRLRSRMHS